MKFLLLALTLTLVAVTKAEWTDEQKEKFIAADKKCIDETKIDPLMPQKMREGIFEDEEKIAQYVVCVNKLLGFQNEAGKFQSDAIKTFIGDNYEVNERLQKCIINNGTAQECALAWAKCVTNKKN